MHKQLLTTAFAAFLALAIVLGVISSTAQQGEGIIESDPETRFEETSSFPMPETSAEPDQTQEEIETTEPETTAESEALTEKVDEAVLLPETPEGAKKLSLYINGRATEEVFCFEKDGIIWLSVEAFGEIFEYGGLSAEAGKCYITSGDRAIPCSKRDVEVTVTDFGLLKILLPLHNSTPFTDLCGLQFLADGCGFINSNIILNICTYSLCA